MTPDSNYEDLPDCSLFIDQNSKRFAKALYFKCLEHFIDPILQDKQRLDEHWEDALEVECRFGNIQGDDDSYRLRFPLDSESLLSNDYRHRFNAGISELQYNKLDVELQLYLSRFDTVIDSDQEDKCIVSGTLSQWIGPACEETVSFFFEKDAQNPESRIRVTYTDECNTNVVERIQKERLSVYDFYTGRNKDEDNTDIIASISNVDRIQNQVDFRIAISHERQILHDPSPKYKLILKRKRIRKTLLQKFGLFKIDYSIIHNLKDNSKSTSKFLHPAYECEIEMNPRYIRTAFEFWYQKNKKVYLQMYCMKFLQLCQALVQFFNNSPNVPALKIVTSLHDPIMTNSEIDNKNKLNSENVKSVSGLTERKMNYTMTQETKRCRIEHLKNAQHENLQFTEQYEKHISTKFPIIGDYLFRAIANNLTPSQ